MPLHSTADVAWTRRWYAAKTALSLIYVHIKGIDMSSAFYARDRKLLLGILQDVLEEYELRPVKFLLCDTDISTKVKGAKEDGNVGTPQGDNLSPVLFIVHLEAALREIRELRNQEENIPSEMAHANNVFHKFDQTQRCQ